MVQAHQENEEKLNETDGRKEFENLRKRIDEAHNRLEQMVLTVEKRKKGLKRTAAAAGILATTKESKRMCNGATKTASPICNI